MADDTLTASSSPIPTPAVTPTPAAGLRGPSGLSPRQNYSRVNTGVPSSSDAGALEQKSIMPKVGSVMSISMATRPRALNDMLKTAMESALGRAKVAEEAKKQLQNLDDDDDEDDKKKKEKDSCMKTSSADHLPTDYVLKLAAAADYVTELLKEGADLAGPYNLTENTTGPGEGPNTLPMGYTTPMGPDHVIHTNSGQAKTNKPGVPGMQKAHPQEHGATQLENDIDHAPGAGDAPTSGSTKNAFAGDGFAHDALARELFGRKKKKTKTAAPLYLLRKMAEEMAADPNAPMAEAAPPMSPADEAAMRATRNSALMGGAMGGGVAGLGAAGLAGLGSLARGGAEGGFMRRAGDMLPTGGGRNAALIAGVGGLGALTGAAAGGLGAYMGAQGDSDLSGTGLGALGGAGGGAAMGALSGASMGAMASPDHPLLGGIGGGVAGGIAGGAAGSGLGAASGFYGKQKVDRALLEQAAAGQPPMEEDPAAKMSAPLWLLRKMAEDATNPAHITAGSAESTRMPISTTGQAGPAASGKNRVPGSADGVASLTRRAAKSVPKAEMAALIDEPMNSAAHDNVLQQAFRHTGEAGAKISSAQNVKLAAAKALLRNLAGGGK